MKRAWLVVDMVEDFVAEDGALTCGAPGQAAVLQLLPRLEDAYAKQELIVFACDAHAPDDQEFALWPVHCVRGTKGAQLYGPLQSFYELHRGERVVLLEKTTYDAFFATDLELLLRSHGVTDVVVAGVCTSICCYATASGAYYRRFAVHAVPDGMADLTSHAHAFAVEQMKNVLKAQIES
ncbi:cysteine hydrolase family protein [Ferroacidibacillus organovorans]|uniref:Isochorismatase-like domain-containing protein n=1 Tax=Ferroacidibacillus organovorans TaxID=1765683 RepID=A0A117SY17_9BACL|nr:isochorismatase family cysteine hydrolase [Ferroacidibacillus organovorans]KUO96303.1 hypothetical protein ATW55_03590 [Ferroacidibacillus organovorans]